MPHRDVLAAVDLGSNSFHLMIARVQDGHLTVIDRLRERVQLADGLDGEHRLSRAAQDRALACLARFGQRLKGLPPHRVRAVGTNTLRAMKNREAFIDAAAAALGHPLEVVSGIEEARLIYQGVIHTAPPSQGKRLVLDIGGGSTEMIIGEGLEPQLLESLHMGCINVTQRFFADGKINLPRLERGDLFVQQELEPVILGFRQTGWRQALGASGSIKAVLQALETRGHPPQATIARGHLEGLSRTLVNLGRCGTLAAAFTLEEDRARVFVGGFVVLLGLFRALDLEAMEVATGALREGLLWDLAGRRQDDDVRRRTVEALIQRFGLDIVHGQRVADTARELWQSVAQAWGLANPALGQALEWAARLHEIGFAIAHSQYHKHGDYILRHADLLGFSRQEQALIAVLVRCHRRKFAVKEFRALPADSVESTQRLGVLLRLSVLLHRSRSHDPLPPLNLRVRRQRLELTFPDGWLADHPLTRADLETETAYLEAAGLELRFR
ncbi:MAG: exopolyphosphatase [Candidatus Competibacterales bacterium]